MELCENGIQAGENRSPCILKAIHWESWCRDDYLYHKKFFVSKAIQQRIAFSDVQLALGKQFKEGEPLCPMRVQKPFLPPG
ncbi:MAG: hypothetical protein ACE3JK_13835 [Sporolactobacillus sp.]